MEWLDEVDEKGRPTGKVYERSYIHDHGIRHRTSHVWIMRQKAGEMQILLQKRSVDKDSFPGEYDISSAGHIPAGEGFEESALRELEEELGITAKAEDLHLIGPLTIRNEFIFHGKPFRDHQITHVYYLVMDIEPEQMRLQESEVESVMWIGLDECIRQTEKGGFPCLFPPELKMLPKAFST